MFTACNQDRSKTTTETETSGEATGTEMMASDTMGQMGGMMAHMHKHMTEMQGMKMTGDPDHDFAQMMTMHHQGSISMAEEEIASGTDSKLKEIANKIISSSKADIQKLQDFRKTHTPAAGDTAKTMQMRKPMQAMMDQMHQQDMSGMTTDQRFAQMMIHHHQSGIGMSREFLQQARSADMKQVAQKIIAEQPKEIKELEAWQQANKP